MATQMNNPEYNIGDTVRVPTRFGETGTVVEYKPEQENPYGVQFENMDVVLYYKAGELRPSRPGGKQFSWWRPPTS